MKVSLLGERVTFGLSKGSFLGESITFGSPKGSLSGERVIFGGAKRSLSFETFIIERFNLSLSDWAWPMRLMAATTEHESIGKEDDIAAIGDFEFATHTVDIITD